MQIVINIDEEDFEIMKHNIAVDNPLCPINQKEMVTKIANGIPLPKGHGRLIDADAFIKQESCCGYIEDMDIDYFKQNTPTIIEADEESEDKRCK